MSDFLKFCRSDAAPGFAFFVLVALVILCTAFIAAIRAWRGR